MRKREAHIIKQEARRVIKYDLVKIMLTLACIYLSTMILAQSTNTSRIKVDFQHKNLDKVINEMAKMNTLTPLFNNQLVEHKQVNYSCEDCSWETVLTDILAPHRLNFKIVDDQLIIINKRKISRTKLISGNIIEKTSGAPIGWATIFYALSLKGEISDEKGDFTIPIRTSDNNDTLIISAVGYKKKRIPVASLWDSTFVTITMEVSPIVLQQIKVKASDYRYETHGTTGKKAHAAVYLDTHGQQVAQRIQATQDNAILESVWLYLSPEGNTTAPFRVRLYNVASNAKGPQQDLIKDFILVQPNGKKGWYEVDFSSQSITIPEQGIFLAIEGVFPNTGTSTSLISEKKPKRKQTLQLLTYGQKIGVRRVKHSNTWHYSLSRTWFQLPEPSYDAMIKIDVRYRKEVRDED